jgi:hypothetical protein
MKKKNKNGEEGIISSGNPGYRLRASDALQNQV